MFLVTGAGGAIGEAISRQLASMGHGVVMVGRSPAKLEVAAERVRRASSSDTVRVELCDLSRQAEIETLASCWSGPLHGLIANHASSPRRRLETPEGIEVQLATNVLGYFWLVRAFAPVMEAGARVVLVASYWAGDLDLDDLEFKRRRYDNHTAYRQSKAADRMLAVALAERLRDRGITVDACHPGDVRSKLSEDLGFGGHESPDEGADTPVWLATTAVEGTGGYYAGRGRQACPFGSRRADVERLVRTCEDYSVPRG